MNLWLYWWGNSRIAITEKLSALLWCSCAVVVAGPHKDVELVSLHSYSLWYIHSTLLLLLDFQSKVRSSISCLVLKQLKILISQTYAEVDCKKTVSQETQISYIVNKKNLTQMPYIVNRKQWNPNVLHCIPKINKSDPNLIHSKQKTTRPKCLTLYTKNNLTQISYIVNKKNLNQISSTVKKIKIYMRKKKPNKKKKKFQLCAHRKSSLFSLATPKESPQARRDLCTKWRRKGRKRRGKRASRD